jgi:hypothetical protein
MVHNSRTLGTEIPRKSVVRISKVLHLLMTMKKHRNWVSKARRRLTVAKTMVQNSERKKTDLPTVFNASPAQSGLIFLVRVLYAVFECFAKSQACKKRGCVNKKV